MRRAGGRGWGRRAVLPSALALLAATFLLVALPEPATAHTGDYILSVPAADPVSVDGNVTAAEWAEAVSINLTGIPGNGLGAFLLVKHNDSFLFVAYDVVGDTSESSGDISLVAFDTGHDGLTTVGREDIFYHAGFFAGEQAHFVSDGTFWSVHDSPYDESLPNHAGLVSAWGFGPSDLSSESHRQFEFRIPLPLLGATPGDTLGILAVVGDLDTGKLSFWPETLVSLQLDSYGDLVLVAPAAANDLLLLPPSRVKNALAGDLVSYQLNVTNRGTSGMDTFDFTANSSWEVTFWDSAGTTPLADTTGEGDPDTGALSAGESALVIAKVEVPTDATGRNEATVTATSSADANVSRGALLITNLPPALFRPPHSDFGNDTDVPPDGLFNYLVVEANLTVAVSGSYIVQGTLYDQNFTSPISFASRSGVVPVGNQTAALLFPGEDVFRSRTNGPYAVDLRIFDDSFPPKELDRNNHTTQPYAYTDFQKPAAVFAPPHSDFGLDTDGDGLFNYLVVTASIDVTDGGMFLVDAVLRDPTYSLFIYTSNVTTLDAGLQTVPLWFDGIRVNASDIDGPYTVELTMYDYVTFEFLDRGAHTTANYSHLEFQSPPAAFAAPHSDFGLDTDGDGLFNYLVVDVNLTVTEAGTYSVDGTLYGSHIGFTSNVTTLTVGSQTVPLWFDGMRINASRVDGPYTVELRLYDYVTFRILDSETHITANYSHLEFEAPPARFSPPHSDFGLDTDGDGVFNNLVVNVSLEVDVAGMYLVDGRLHDGNFTFQIFSYNVTNLDVGSQSVQLFFQGTPINASEVDGPYTVDLNLYDYVTFTFLDEDTYNTTAYSYLDFDGPPARFSPPHADQGLDTNGDGQFEFLVVNATVQVDEAGDFAIEAYLYDPSFRLFVSTYNLTFLDVGVHAVSLLFDGISINVSGVDGPYTAEFYLYNASSFEFLDNDSHTTAAYSHLEFEGPPASLAPPHSDRGLDTDGDGLFNYLVVDVAIDVADAGTVLLEAYLYDSTFTLFLAISNVTSLEVGPQTVPLWFDGALITASERDGPYTVELYLYDYETFRFLGSDIHTTAPYSSQEFEGPEPLVASEALVTPTIDGAFSPGEWSDASAVNLSAIPGNEVPGFLLVKSDDDFLYVAYDATGDTTEDLFDVASIAFDTDHDGVATDGREDQFVQGGWVSNDQAHFVYDASAGFWIEEDSPYDTSLPNHLGLASAWGFGPSENEGTPHRIYEFSIPLALLGVAPGGTLGFFGGSEPAPGLFDASIGGWSLWPVWNPGPLSLSEYGDLVLSMPTDIILPTLVINAPSSGSVEAGSGVLIAWSASDDQSGLDYLEVSLDDGAPIVLAASVTGYTFLGLEDGSHTVVVRAVDVAGNAQTASVDFTVDTVPPTLSILSPGSEAVLNTSRVEVAWAAEDATSGVDRIEVVVDGGPPTLLLGGSIGLVFSEMSDGPHTIEVRAIDGAGHVALASVQFVVDTVPPVLSISLPVSGSVVTSSSLEVAWLGTDQTSGIERIEVSLDGGAPVVLPATVSSHTFTGVADGSHTVSVTVFDRAGNSADASVDFEVITFLLNPAGPFGPSPLVGLIVAIVAGTLLLLMVFRRRRGSPPRALLGQGPSMKGEEPPSAADMTAQIRELEKLRDEGLITEEEFRVKTEELLSRR
ncbi:MAG: Ig-like domain-containing protein [Thermoplasmata archaeon]